MRLTDEDVRRHKENKYSVECVKGKVKMSDGDIIGNLCDTIEVLQQEYDELDTGHSKLFKAYCEMKQEAEQLQAQNGAMRQQLEIIKANIHEFPPEGMTIGKQVWIKTTEKALSAAPTDYHNPADVAEIEQRGEWIDQQATKILRQQAVLKRAREALDEVNNYSGYEQGFDHDSLLDEVEEAIAAIENIGGREDE